MTKGHTDTTDWLSELKTRDPERYTACLYLPSAIRNDVACLYTFDAEISHIPELVSEPMPGEVRMQFWRDLITNGSAKGVGPMAESLLEVVEQHSLPREVLYNYLNARVFDLYHDPMPDMASFEGYLGETHSILFQLAAFIAGGEPGTRMADACGHAGVAFGIARLLASLARHHGSQRIYIPEDILAKHGMSSSIWLSEPVGETHLQVIGEMVQLARSHRKLADQAVSGLADKIAPVFMPLAFVEPLLKKIENTGSDLFVHPVALGNLQRQWVALKRAVFF